MPWSGECELDLTFGLLGGVGVVKLRRYALIIFPARLSGMSAYRGFVASNNAVIVGLIGRRHIGEGVMVLGRELGWVEWIGGGRGS